MEQMKVPVGAARTGEPDRCDAPGPATGTTAEAAARLRLAVMRLARRIRRQVAQEVSQSQVSVLVSVERRGRPTLGELAAAEHVRPPSMTRQVDALVSAGLLTRDVDPDDRRVVRVELTSAGRRALQRSRSLRNAYLVRRLDRLTPEDRARLDELVTLLERLVEMG